jgi:hypothetical protein
MLVRGAQRPRLPELRAKPDCPKPAFTRLPINLGSFDPTTFINEVHLAVVFGSRLFLCSLSDTYRVPAWPDETCDGRPHDSPQPPVDMSSRDAQVNLGNAKLSHLQAGLSVSCAANASLQSGNDVLSLSSAINADGFTSSEIWLRVAEPIRFSLELKDYDCLEDNASSDISLQQTLVEFLQSSVVSTQPLVKNTLI